MHNFWIIFKDEYTKRTGKRSFLITTIGIPFLFAILIGVIIIFSVSTAGEKPIGYVDQSGLIQGEVSLPRDQKDFSIEIKRFTDRTAAEDALKIGQIQSYYVIPSDYLKTRKLVRNDWQSGPNTMSQSQFARFLRSNLASSLSPVEQQLILEGPELSIRSMDGSREIANGNPAGILFPIAAGLLFFVSTMSSAGYLLQAVADEKENRTMEILMTSVSPNQFICGKALSLMAVALTQLAVWLVVIVAGLMIGANYLPELRSIQIPADYLFIVLLFFLPAFALVAGIMISIGSAVTEMRQGQQIAGIVNMLFILPIFFLALMLTAPNSLLMVILTIFPTTSFITISMRWGLSAIPLTQLVLSWVLLVITAVASIWAATRIFRLGMLRYGQQLSLRSALAALHIQKQTQPGLES